MMARAVADVSASNGGGGSVFATTRWTLVLSARAAESPAANKALAQLCEIYWQPLFVFLRRQGYSKDDAQDLVQGFFERFLAPDYLRDVRREKGRFRSFLLAALRHYVANTHRDSHTQRRGGGHLHVALEEPGVAEHCERLSRLEQPPEILFDRAWAEAVMAAAARQLRAQYADSGQAALYEVICVWLAAEAKAGEYARAAAGLGRSVGALAAAVHRLRRRFRALVRANVANTVQSAADIDEEMRHLFRVLTTT